MLLFVPYGEVWSVLIRYGDPIFLLISFPEPGKPTLEVSPEFPQLFPEESVRMITGKLQLFPLLWNVNSAFSTLFSS